MNTLLPAPAASAKGFDGSMFQTLPILRLMFADARCLGNQLFLRKLQCRLGKSHVTAA